MCSPALKSKNRLYRYCYYMYNLFCCKTCDQAYKRGSVYAAIYLGIASPQMLGATFWDRRTNDNIPLGVASDRVYRAIRSPVCW